MQLAAELRFEKVGESHAKSTWWVLHHSLDPDRRAVVLTCYLDESGTDNDSSIAVVAGLILDMRGFFWIDQELRKCLLAHNIPWPLHMKEFGEHGKLAHLRSEDRRSLFTDLVPIINGIKRSSVAATLTSEQYRRIFDGLTEFSMYGASFLMLAMVNGAGAQLGGYNLPLAYLLDTGNRFRKDVVEAHAYLIANKDTYPLRVGALGFDSDDDISALQAADVISWSVRRKLASQLKSGFEPLADLFDENHIEVPYKEEWMRNVADALRAKMNP